MTTLTGGAATRPAPEPDLPGHEAPNGDSPADARPIDASGPLRQLVLRMHFYAGVLVGPFLLVAAISGFLYALAPTAEKILYHDQLTASSAAQTTPLGEQVDTARTRHPGLEVTGVVPGADGATTRVLFGDDTLPTSSYSRVVFVDPADGAIRGDTVQYGSSQALPLRTWLSETHRRLHLGEPGRLYSELAASWLAPIALGGLYLWWRRTRRGTRDGRRATALLRADRTATGRARQRSRHAVLGTWVLLGALGLSVTGLTWSAHSGERVSALWDALDWRTPTLSQKAPAAGGADAHAAHAGHEGHGAQAGAAGAAGEAGAAGTTPAADPLAGLEAARDTARTAGLHDPVQLTPPAHPGDRWLAKEVRRPWSAGPDTVTVDAGSGTVVERLPFSAYPPGAKLTDWGVRLHMGLLFGLANQVLLAALAAALVVVTVRGYVMWWMRRPTRRPVGRAPVRGALRELWRRRPVATLLCAAALLAVGWAVPLLGLSLLAFLAVDTAVGVSRRRLSR